MTRRQVGVRVEEWKTKSVFKITGLARTAFKLVVVQIAGGGHVGTGEGLPIHYLGETTDSMLDAIETALPAIAAGADRDDLRRLLTPGGARNALDAALWDLEAKTTGRDIWQLTGISPAPVRTCLTIGIANSAEHMAAQAVQASDFTVLKLKVDNEDPVGRVAAVRRVRPDAMLVVDANQGWDIEDLRAHAPRLAELGVALIEQPLPRGDDAALVDFVSPVPLSADESFQHEGDLETVARRYHIANIKLDKVGGLTEGLALADQASRRGMRLLVSNMGGTSLSMAPAFVLAQRCEFAELDGPFVLRHDRLPAMVCSRGALAAPDARLWG